MLRWTGTPTLTIAPFDGTFHPFDGDAKKLRRLAVVDTETVGLDIDDPVIEIAVRVFAYDPADGQIRGAVDEYQSLQDPGCEVPAEITALTGITNDAVRGQAINAGRVHVLLASANLIVAHNAAFDRPRVDAVIAAGPPLLNAVSVPWACSSSMVDWRALGLPSQSLGALCLAHGFYTDAHRAMGDVTALARLLGTRNAETGRTYLGTLLAEARLPAVTVRAWGSPFDSKEALKGRHYHWEAARKVWWREIREVDVDVEREWLATRVYGGRNAATFERIRPAERFARAA